MPVKSMTIWGRLLVRDTTLDVFEYTRSFIRRFEDEVRDRLGRLS